MIPELPPNPRAELESRVTAWLLGELPADEAAAVRRQVEGDLELQKLRDRLSQTLNLLRETVATPVGETPALPKPLKLSAARREQLLAQFKTIRPKEFQPAKKWKISWVAVLAAAACILFVMSMSLPHLSGFKGGIQSMETAGDDSRAVADKFTLEQKASAPADSVKTAENLAVRGEEARIAKELRERRLAENAPAPATPPSGGIVLPQSTGAVESEQLAGLNRDGGVQTDFKAKVENGITLGVDRSFSDANGTPQALPPPAVVSAPAPAGVAGVVTLNGSFGGGGGASGLDSALFPANKTPQPNLPSAATTAPASGDAIVQFNTHGEIASATAPRIGGEFRLYADDGKAQAGLPGGNQIELQYVTKTNSAVEHPATRSAFQQNLGKLNDQLAENEKTASGEPAKKDSDKLAWPSGKFTGSLDNEDLKTTETAPAHAGMRMLQKEYESRSRKPATLTPIAGMEPPVSTAAASIPPGSPAPEFVGRPMDNGGVSKTELAGGNTYYAGATNGVVTYNFRTASSPTVSGGSIGGVAATSVVNSGFISSNGWVLTQSKAANVDLLGDVPVAQAAKRDSAVEQRLEKLRQLPPPQKISGAVDAPAARPFVPAPVPQPEVLTSINAFTTFSLNVSDVAFKLAQASLQNGQMPDASSMRSEEFINAFDYRDPEPVPGAPIGFAWERAGDPFTHGRDFLRFSVKSAAQGRAAGRPLNLVLLLDKSGSMERADRVEIIARALQVLASQLHENDTLSVVVFARTARLFVDGVPGSQAGDVAKKLRDLTPEGGTNLEEAMRLAYEAAMRHYLANGENRVVLLTDGAANLGNVEPTALKRSVESNRKQGIALDCFGVGWDGYNDPMLETLSRAGNGRYGFINTPEEAATEFAGKLAGALRVAANDVKVQVEFNPDRVAAYRQIGYAKDQLKKEDFRNNAVKAAQIGAAESGNALYTIQIKASGDGPIGTVHVRYRVPGTEDYQEHEWIVPYNGGSVPLDKASPALRLAATAAEFAEMLAGNPYAAGVTPDLLLNYLRGVPQIYGADQRPTQLEWMIRQTKSISGK